MGVLHVSLKKGDGQILVDVLSLPDAAIRAQGTFGAQGALQNGHLDQASLPLESEIFQLIIEKNFKV